MISTTGSTSDVSCSTSSISISGGDGGGSISPSASTVTSTDPPTERTMLLAPHASPSDRPSYASTDNDGDGHSCSDSQGHIFASMRSFKDIVYRNVMQHTGEIGMLGSVAIAINSLTGPAMLQLPATFQRSGIIPTFLALTISCALSAMCSLHTANVISKVPGNANFQREIEYSDVFDEFLGRRWFYFSQILFFCCITCLNISSLVATAQVADTMMGHWFPGGSAAVTLNFDRGLPHVGWMRWDFSECIKDGELIEGCTPFVEEEEAFLLTVGYVCSVAALLPLALMDLKDNSTTQIIGFMILITCCCQFASTFIANGLDTSNVSWWGTNWNSLMGVTIFNFALVLAIPAWLYEKKEEVDVSRVINGSSMMSMALYVVVGGLGALAVPNVSDNMLESMMSGDLGKLTQVTSCAFAFFIIGLGVPLFSVLTRLSLTGGAHFSTPSANILAIYLPFASSWMLYNGEAITRLLSWGGVICTSLVVFILPLIIALYALLTNERAGSIDIYSGIWENRSKEEEKKFLALLLATSFVLICIAIVGNILS